MKTLGYGIKQGFKNIVQNKIFSLVAIGTIAICLFLLGLFYALLSNFQHMMYNVESNVGLTVFFDSGIEPEEIDSLGEQIRKLDGVETVDYISPTEAWKKFQKEMYQGTFLSLKPYMKYFDIDILEEKILSAGMANEEQILLPMTYDYFLYAFTTQDLPENIMVIFCETAFFL